MISPNFLFFFLTIVTNRTKLPVNLERGVSFSNQVSWPNLRVSEDCLWESRKDKGTDRSFSSGREERTAVNVPTNELFQPGERKRKSMTLASIFFTTAICLRLLIPRDREKNLCKYVAKRTKWFFDHVKVIFRVIYADGNTLNMYQW